MTISDRLRLSRAHLQAALAFAVYLVYSWLLFLLPIAGKLQTHCVGQGPDPRYVIWFLHWWPFAVSHGLNPFHSDYVWAPAGFNLSWGTSVPFLSLIGAPLDMLAGPILEFNILMWLIPALSAFSAFLLCRELTGRWAPSLMGGYLFGFSSYELAQMTSHMHMACTFVVPLLLLQTVRLFRGSVGNRGFVMTFAVLLASQCYISLEQFATTMFWLAIGLLTAWSMNLGDLKEKMRSFARPCLTAVTLAVALAGPLLYNALAFKHPGEPINSSFFYSIDLLNFFIPTRLTWLNTGGAQKIAESYPALQFSSHVQPNLSEDGAYLGLPLLLMLVWYFHASWRTTIGRWLCLALGLVTLFACGSTLHVAGVPIITSPARVLDFVPLIHHAAPARFFMYGWLLVAVIAALWLADSRIPTLQRVALGSLAILFILPNPSLSVWSSQVDLRSFFNPETVRKYIRPGEIVMCAPYGDASSSTVWQVQSDMYFRLSAGYDSIMVPPEVKRWPIVAALHYGKPVANPVEEMRRYVREKGISAIVLTDPDSKLWSETFAALEGQSQAVGDIRLYRLNSSPPTNERTPLTNRP